MIHNILAAVDFSPRSGSVVEAAAEVAAKFGAKVTVVNVLAMPQEYPPAAATIADPLPAQVQQAAQKSLADLAAKHPGVTFEAPVVFAGQPWRAIVEKARAMDADLIVIGSHGYRGWDRILGTTAGKVADHADRNVLVVHAAH